MALIPPELVTGIHALYDAVTGLLAGIRDLGPRIDRLTTALERAAEAQRETR